MKDYNPTIDHLFIKYLKNNTKKGKTAEAGHINVSDPRALRKGLLYIKELPLSLRTNMCSNREDNILSKSVLNSFVGGFSKHAIRNESTPFLDKEMLGITLNKIHFLIDYCCSKSSFLSQKCGVSYLVSIEELCGAICDCAFKAVSWSEQEATPIIRNILNSQSMGSISLFKASIIVNYISSKDIREQALFGTKKSWLKFTRSIIVSKVNCKSFRDIDSRAKNLVDIRTPETDAILSGVIKYLCIDDYKDRILLKSKATIFEYAAIDFSDGNKDIRPGYIAFSLKIILDNLAYSLENLSLARGLLSVVFIRTNPVELERILNASSYAKKVVSRNKKGIKCKANIPTEYRRKGLQHLRECIGKEQLLEYKFCKTIEFYYSLNRSNKKSLSCKNIDASK